MSSFLSRKAVFLAAFVAADEEAVPFSTLRNIASTTNCFFQPLPSCSERKAQAVYLQHIARFFINATSSNFVCLDLEDLICCLRRNLSAFICSASASGTDAGINAARQLAEQIEAHNPRRFASSIVHITMPASAPSSEIVNCCNYLGRSYHLGEWLFSVSRKNESSFTVDFLGASHV